MKDLHQLIESYFDCALSEQEERELKRRLAELLKDADAQRLPEDVREAAAVMGVFAMERKGASVRESENTVIRTAHSRKSPRHLARYAAAAAIALVVGFTGVRYVAGNQADSQTDVCVMYAEGKVINNEETILAQMTSELSVIGDAAECADNTMSSQLANIADIMD